MINKRDEQRKQWWLKHGKDHTVKPSMHRRKSFHDYYSRCIYMITIEVNGRRKLLGSLQSPDETHPAPWIAPSSLGNRVLHYWQEIPNHHPHVRLLSCQLMPDHFHGILFITERTEVHLGTIINSFKKAGNFDAKELSLAPLWEKGYNDIFLSKKGQLDHMIHYVEDNPRRLWVKKNNPELFKIKRDISVAGIKLSALGNTFLLDYPIKAAVQCTRKLTDEQIAQEVERFMEMARHGAVLVSPAISKGEKTVISAAQESGAPVIKLIENGFTPMWKPSGKDFDACAQGKLLLITPWEHHNQKLDITRDKCLKLNHIAALIANSQ